jgi:nitrite reductase/ring-hydroxylating ferredoxin subunit
MDRKAFLIKGCLGCAGVLIGTTILESCAPGKHVAGTMADSGMLVDLDKFEGKDGKSVGYVVVRNDSLQYPVCVYKLSDASYSAVLLRCTHQGAELQVAGDRLTCPAHGSEFDNKGIVKEGPASENLRSFPVSVRGSQLFIDLRKRS